MTTPAQIYAVGRRAQEEAQGASASPQREPEALWRGEATVYGEAAAQGSKTPFANRKTGKVILVDSDRRLKSWRSQMQDEMRACAPVTPWDAPMSVFLTVYVPRPLAHYGTGRNAGVLKANAPALPPSGKDLDKIARATGDSGSGIWWRDDSRIVSWTILRLYDDHERTVVRATLAVDVPSVERRVSMIVRVR